MTSGTTYHDTAVPAGSTHTYTVSAYDAAGNESAQSSPPASGVAGAGSGGNTPTVGATDDATISRLAANTGTNYGTQPTLIVDSDQNMNDFLMKFTVPTGCTPTAATLNLTVASGSTSGSAHGGAVYAAPGAWDEGSVTANNAPGTVGSPATLNAVTAGSTYPLDVTSQLANATVGSTISLRAVPTTTDAATYVSRNAKNGATAGPQLQLTCGGGDTTAPSVPGSVAAATGSTAGSIDVSWAASSDNVAVTGYHVYRDGGTTAIAAVPSGTTYTDTGLTAGSPHTYTVSAFDAAGNESGQSTPPASANAGAGSGGGTVTVAPTDDATIALASGSTGVNYGKATTLIVDGDQNINNFLVKFTVPAGCTPTAAMLTLTVGSVSNNGSANGGSLYAAPGSWAEGTVTGASAPPVTGSPVSLGPVAVNNSYNVNVFSLLPAGATGGSIVSIRATTTSSDAAIYVSKDAQNGATAGPQLQLTC